MENDNPVPNPVNELKTSSSKLPLFAGIGVLIILVGLLFGWFISSKKIASNKAGKVTSNPVTVSANEAGISDVSKYKDGPIGTLQSGGIKGEGKYHLDRPGGPTQTVYLTSSIVSLADFVGKKVQVWGDTEAAQYAPWLMDVVKIKVVQ